MNIKSLERILPATKRDLRDLLNYFIRSDCELKAIQNSINEQENCIKLLSEQRDRLLDRHYSEIEHSLEGLYVIIQGVKDQTTLIQSSNKSLTENNDESLRSIHNHHKVLQEHKQVVDKIDNIIQDMSRDLKELWTFMRRTRSQLDYHQTIIREIEWAQIFRDTVSGCPWLKDTSFSLGRWAAGYQLMYVLFQILKQKRPKSILELGMGQSTKMITQYVNDHDNIKHVVVEHDLQWIFFSKNNFEISEHTKILQLDIAEKKLDNGTLIKTYNRFSEAVSQDKYDLIVIDAPFGGDTQLCSRIDILDVLPHCLLPSFVVILDDYNRAGEKATGEAICEILNANGIPFSSGIYRGKKESLVITSTDNAFICTL